MSNLDFAGIRKGAAGCPSDLTLDRLVAGELPVGEAERVETHAAACTTCEKRLALFRKGFDAVPQIDPRRSLARLRTKLDMPRGFMERLRAALRRFGMIFLPLAAVGVASLVVVLRQGAGTNRLPGLEARGDDAIRWKGGLQLRVHRMNGKGSEEVESGQVFHAGDRLRFVVDLPREARIRIVSLEAGGRLSTAWPLGNEGTEGEAPAQGSEAGVTGKERRPAGAAQILPGAVELDDSLQAETLYLVSCPLDAGAPDCKVQGGQAELVCPEGCATARFTLNKAR